MGVSEIRVSTNKETYLGKVCNKEDEMTGLQLAVRHSVSDYH